MYLMSLRCTLIYVGETLGDGMSQTLSVILQKQLLTAGCTLCPVCESPHRRLGVSQTQMCVTLRGAVSLPATADASYFTLRF